MAWGVPKIGAIVTVTSGDVALTEPAGIAQGDLMIACIAYRSNVAFTLPTGWTLVATQQSSGDIDATNGIASGVMAWIVRGASAPALTFTRTLGDLGHGRIIAYAGGNATPGDTGTANTLAVASATATTGTLTTAEANELIVAMVSCGDNLTSSAFDAATDPTTASGATDTTTAPTAGTWIERSDAGTNTGADGALAIADAIRATAGATGQIQATVSVSARHVMIAGAFKMAAAVTTPITVAATAVGAAAVTDVATFPRTAAATAVGVSAVVVALVASIAAAAVAVGTAAVSITTLGKLVSAVATGVVAVALTATRFITVGAAAIGLAAVTDAFIPGGGGSAWPVAPVTAHPVAPPLTTRTKLMRRR